MTPRVILRRTLVLLFGLLASLSIAALLLVGWLLTTTSGAQWVASAAQDWEPRLRLQVDSGSLWAGLGVSAFAWRDRSVEVTIERLQARWTLPCLLRRQVCLDSVRAQRVYVAARRGAEPSPEPVKPLELPVAIRLDRLEVAELTVQVDELDLAVQHLELDGRLNQRGLRLGNVRLRGMDLGLPPPSAETAPPADAAQPIELPTVELPLAVRIRALRLENGRVRRGEDEWRLQSLALSARLRGQQLSIRRLVLEHPQLRARARGQVRLAGDYPLSLDLELHTPQLLGQGPLTTTLALRQSLAALQLQARTQGVLAVALEGTVQPLQPSLPFALYASWQRQAWPLAGDPAVTARNGSAELLGDLQHYRLSVQTALDGERIPAGDWSLRAQGDLAGLLIERLEGAILDGRLLASGRLAWKEGFSWDIRLALRGLDPGRHWEEFPGRLHGELVSTGAISHEGWQLWVRTTNLSGELRSYPLTLQAELAKDAADRWDLRRLRLASGENRIELRGTLSDVWDLEGRFQLPQAQALLPEAAGSARGHFRLGGALARPDMEFTASARHLRWQERLRLDAVRVEGRIAELGEAPSRLQWRLTGLTVGEQVLPRIEGRLEGRLEEHSLTLETELELDQDIATLALRADGSLAGRDWRGRLLQSRLRLPQQRWRLLEAVPLHWQDASRRLLVGAHCWGYRRARLCLQENAALGVQAGAAALALSGYQAEWLARWLPPGIHWTGPLSGEAAVGWDSEGPRLRLHASSNEGLVLLSQEDQPALRLSYRQVALRAELADGGLRAHLELASEALGNARVDAQAVPQDGEYGLAGNIAVEGLRADLAQPFFPQLQTLTGRISASGELGGTLSRPEFTGEIRLQDGAVAAPELPMELSDIALRLRVAGNGGQLDGSFRSGTGTGELGGELDWTNPAAWLADIRITGERLQAVYQPIARVQLSPDLRVAIRPGAVAVTGTISVPSGSVTLHALPAQAVPVSDDVVIVRRPENYRHPLEQQAPSGSAWTITANIQVSLGEEVSLSGYGVQGRLTGALRIRQEAQGVPEGFGEIRVEDGRYEAYGQRLTIRQGRLTFAGPVTDPNLNIEAVRVIDEVTAGIRILGQPAEPRAELFSEPVMPPEDILSYIVRGRPLADAGPGGDEALAQAMLALGALGGQELTAGIAEQLGVEEFALDVAGEGEGAQFLVSGYINPRLFLQYGVGVFEPTQQLTVRYRLSRRFYVEALRGVQNALDFFYTFEF